MAQAKSIEKKANTGFDKAMYMTWYETMLRIRRFEERTLMMYSKQKIRGFCHVYIGQEAIAAGMVTAIRPEDAVVTAYRQHGTAISRGLPTNQCMAELYGKSTGVNKGEGWINALLLEGASILWGQWHRGCPDTYWYWNSFRREISGHRPALCDYVW